MKSVILSIAMVGAFVANRAQAADEIGRAHV